MAARPEPGQPGRCIPQTLSQHTPTLLQRSPIRHRGGRLWRLGNLALERKLSKREGIKGGKFGTDHTKFNRFKTSKWSDLA